eukprot:CAMPEP_0172779006 /NCGR_PEP_ID=MMETSP1074-20121228/202201_1 /TAXON_ID=2916 /ORGANISM="Ceratium fusus, Strain PA161109" /LENGTH=321 /DNA_ID=CAMNT_0013615961 /DNA_START=73 /DNA_END=1035 /DNA_ORIENTATION=-
MAVRLRHLLLACTPMRNLNPCLVRGVEDEYRQAVQWHKADLSVGHEPDAIPLHDGVAEVSNLLPSAACCVEEHNGLVLEWCKDYPAISQQLAARPFETSLPISNHLGCLGVQIKNHNGWVGEGDEYQPQLAAGPFETSLPMSNHLGCLGVQIKNHNGWVGEGDEYQPVVFQQIATTPFGVPFEVAHLLPCLGDGVEDDNPGVIVWNEKDPAVRQRYATAELWEVWILLPCRVNWNLLPRLSHGIKYENVEAILWNEDDLAVRQSGTATPFAIALKMPNFLRLPAHWVEKEDRLTVEGCEHDSAISERATLAELKALRVGEV